MNATNVAPTRFKQYYGLSVLEFSSQYGSHSRGKWSYQAQNISGSPTIFPYYGDHTQALVTREYGTIWKEGPSGKVFRLPYAAHESPRTLDFVDVQIPQGKDFNVVSVFETFHPGSVIGIWTHSNGMWYRLWKQIYKKPTEIEKKACILRCRLRRQMDFCVFFLRLELESTEHGNHAQLDAISISKEWQYDMDDLLLPSGTNSQLSDILDASQPCSNPWIPRLPIEIWDHILSYTSLQDLIRLSMVSKGLKDVVVLSRRIQILDLKPSWMLVSGNSFQSLSHLCQNGIRMLDLSWCGLHMGADYVKQLHDFILTMTSQLRQLTRLRLNKSIISKATLQYILQNSQLTELSLEGAQIVDQTSAELDEDIWHLDDIPKDAFNRLEALNLSGLSMETAPIIRLIEFAPNLRHLDVSNCLNANLDAILATLERCSRRMISIQAWRMSISEGFHSLAKMTSLEEIDIGWSSLNGEHTYADWKRFIQNAVNLKKLFVGAFRQINDGDLLVLAQTCSHLEQVDLVGISSITHAGISSLLENCFHLKMMDVSFCHGICGSSMKKLREKYPRVNICACDFTPRLNQITDHLDERT